MIYTYTYSSLSIPPPRSTPRCRAVVLLAVATTAPLPLHRSDELRGIRQRLLAAHGRRQVLQVVGPVAEGQRLAVEPVLRLDPRAKSLENRANSRTPGPSRPRNQVKTGAVEPHQGLVVPREHVGDPGVEDARFGADATLTSHDHEDRRAGAPEMRVVLVVSPHRIHIKPAELTWFSGRFRRFTRDLSRFQAVCPVRTALRKPLKVPVAAGRLHPRQRNGSRAAGTITVSRALRSST